MKRVVFLCGSVLALASNAVPSVRAQGAQQKEEGPEPARVIEGRLTPADPIDAVTGQPSKVHDVQLRAGRAYTIALEQAAPKPSFDPLVRVTDAEGLEVARDDDTGGGLNALAYLVAPRTGTYRVVATTLKGTGAYVVKVAPTKVHEVGKDGLELDGKLTRDAPRLAPLKGAPFRAYFVRLSAGMSYIVELKSQDFDAFLVVGNQHDKQLAFDDDSGGGLNARLPFRPPQDGVYRIVALALDGKLGEFRLQVHQGQLSSDQDLAVEARRLTGEGKLLWQHGDPREAAALLKSALAIREKLYPQARFPEGHPDVADSLNNLAVTLNTAGQTEEAVAYHLRALAMRERLYPPTRFPDGHPQLARTLYNLAAALLSMNQPEKALPHGLRALAVREKLYPAARFPEGHLDLAQSLSDVGSTYSRLGDPAKALAYAERALAMKEKLYLTRDFPDGHPELAQSLTNLAAACSPLRQPDRALTYMKRALAMNEKLYPPERFPTGHPLLAKSVHDVGQVLGTLARTGAALSYYERSLAMRERLYPPNRFPDGHADLLRSLCELGTELRLLGKPGAALPHAERGLAMAERLYPATRYPDGHSDLAEAVSALGLVQQALGSGRVALVPFERALAMQQALHPDPDRSVVVALNNLATTLDALGQPQKALAYLARRRVGGSMAAA